MVYLKLKSQYLIRHLAVILLPATWPKLKLSVDILLLRFESSGA
jgi:hypothetical protein